LFLTYNGSMDDCILKGLATFDSIQSNLSWSSHIKPRKFHISHYNNYLHQWSHSQHARFLHDPRSQVGIWMEFLFLLGTAHQDTTWTLEAQVLPCRFYNTAESTKIWWERLEDLHFLSMQTMFLETMYVHLHVSESDLNSICTRHALSNYACFN